MSMREYEDKLLRIVVDLIENKGVTQFYSGYRGKFDVFCSSLIYRLKERYPQIKNTMVLSYLPAKFNTPDNAFTVPQYFDDSVYLLERRVPQQLAIVETNKRLVDTADYIVAGIIVRAGGAYTACEYARKRNKIIVNVIDSLKI